MPDLFTDTLPALRERLGRLEDEAHARLDEAEDERRLTRRRTLRAAAHRYLDAAEAVLEQIDREAGEV